MTLRTRIKICGITRREDLAAAVAAGADAVGFVAYAQSPRFVGPDAAARLALALPAFVTPVVLFVNPSRDEVGAYLDAFPGYVLQFHGDEPPEACEQFGNAYIKAIRMREGIDAVALANAHPRAQAVLLDADSAGYGGSGETFDWGRVDRAAFAHPVILSGGLTPHNVGAGIAALRPWAVDVSSGVERIKGEKDAGKIQAFVTAVCAADRLREPIEAETHS